LAIGIRLLLYLEVLVKEDKITHPVAGRGTHGTDHDIP